MSNIELKKDSNSVSKVSEESLKLFFSNFKNVPSDKIMFFIELCKSQGLNPFNNEVHVVNFKGQLTLITSYTTYLDRIYRSGLVEYIKHDFVRKEDIYRNKEDVFCVVYIKRKDFADEFRYELALSDAIKQNSEYSYSSQNPRFMHLKVTAIQAIRFVFSDIIKLPYAKEELETIDNIKDITPTAEIKVDAIVERQQDIKQQNDVHEERLNKILQIGKRVYLKNPDRWKEIFRLSNQSGTYSNEEVEKAISIIESEIEQDNDNKEGDNNER